ERRHPLIWSGALHYDYQSTPARLRNISATGTMIETAASLAQGAEPLLDLGESGSIFATVVWATGDQAGLRFNQPFDLTQLVKSRPQVASSNWEPPSYLRTDASANSGWESHWNCMTLNELSDDLEGWLKR